MRTCGWEGNLFPARIWEKLKKKLMKEGKKKRDTNEVETRQVLHINLILRPVHITIVAVEKQ